MTEFDPSPAWFGGCSFWAAETDELSGARVVGAEQSEQRRWT